MLVHIAAPRSYRGCGTNIVVSLQNEFPQGRTFWDFWALHQHIYSSHELDASADETLWEEIQFPSPLPTRSRSPRRRGGGGDAGGGPGGGGGNRGGGGGGTAAAALRNVPTATLLDEIARRCVR